MGGLVKAVTAPVRAVANVFKSPKSPDFPALPEPTVMPIADDLARKKQMRRSISSRLQGGGRASTMLTDGQGKLGG